MFTLRKVCRNQSGRDFVVGDVHGHLTQLRRQLNDLDFEPESDRLFCLGDVIDRGPDGEAVLAMIDQRTYFSILGNHEAMMIAGYEERGGELLHQMNGGEWFYRIPADRQQRCVDRVRSWPWAMEIETDCGSVGLIHANVPQSSWIEVTRQLRAIDDAWKSGSALSEDCLDGVAKKLLWDRALVSRLYSDILQREENQRLLAEFVQSRRHGEEWRPPAAPQQLEPFQISGVQAVYMGHTYVPHPMHVGRCHFLDTFREQPGETLGIICINGR